MCHDGGAFLVRRMSNMSTLKDDVFKKYITGSVDYVLGPPSSAPQSFHLVNNLMLEDTHELWALPRANGLAQVLFVFCMSYAGNYVKHTGWDQDNVVIPGVQEARVRAIRAARTLLNGNGGRRTAGDKEAKKEGTTELEYYQEKFEDLLSTLESDCALALKRHGELIKSRANATTKNGASTSAAATQAATVTNPGRASEKRY